MVCVTGVWGEPAGRIGVAGDLCLSSACQGVAIEADERGRDTGNVAESIRPHHDPKEAHMSSNNIATMSQIWQLAPRLALILTLPDPPPFERINAQAGK